MESLIVKILIGHIVGDYWLQTSAMAYGKSKKGVKGTLWCTLHCLIYTLSVCLFIWNFQPLIIFLVFLSHWPIDRWSLALKWLKIIRRNDFDNPNQLKSTFTAIVYVVMDNSLHFYLLWLIVTKLT
ncbi:MAG: DUF3307 domain-containing protein [Candidatus Nealsonbacteria bacterium]|nr:DUF3307 domain-containing protein [Candidatus Nealsonbacteria bacterium]